MSIFLSYARGDDEPFTKRLNDDLVARGFSVWWDRVSMPSRALTFLHEIRDAIAERERLILVIGPEALSSAYVEAEWRYAQENGKAINAVLRRGSYEQLPDELRFFDVLDFRDDSQYEGQIERLIQQISVPVAPMGRLLGVPSLPPHLMKRPDLLYRLRESVLTDLYHPAVAPQAVGIHGMAGVGKSVTATMLAHDHETRRAFPDGIFWIPIGRNTALTVRQREILHALGDSAPFDTIQEGKAKLSALLSDRLVLLILDDVWEPGSVHAFDVLAPRSRMVITTRDASLITATGATYLEVPLLDAAESLALLSGWTDIFNEPSKHICELAKECGGLPLALSICGALVRDRTPAADLLAALRDSDLAFLDHSSGSVVNSIKVSVDALTEEQRRRFVELAVFSRDGSLPEAAVVTLWTHTGRLSERQARRLLTEMEGKSLLRRNVRAPHPDASPARDVVLHELLFEYAVGEATRIPGGVGTLHRNLIDAYRERCPEGWASAPDDGYFFQHLRDHLTAAGLGDEFVALLLDPAWLEVKNEKGLVFDLLRDFTAARAAATSRPEGPLLELLDQALRRDVHFVARHSENYPQALFQCLWNSGWWYDAPDAAAHDEVSFGGRGVEGPPWARTGPKLFQLLESWGYWRGRKYGRFQWLRSLRPPPIPLSHALRAKLSGHLGEVSGLAFSHDDRFVVSASRDQSIRMWDIRTGEVIATIEDRLPTTGDRWDRPSTTRMPSLFVGTGGVNCIALRRSMPWVVAGSYHGALRLWDLESRVELRRFNGHEDWVWSVDWSSDGSTIVSGSDDGTLRVWDADTGQERHCIRGHGKWVKAVTISPDGSAVASAGGDATVRVWDVRSGAERFRSRVRSSIEILRFLSDGRLIALGGDHRLYIMDKKRLVPLSKATFGRIKSIACMGDLVAVADEEGIGVYDAGTWHPRGRVEIATGPIQSLAFASDGKSLAYADDSKSIGVVDWSPAATFSRARKRPTLKRGAARPVIGDIRAVAFSPSGDVVATTVEDFRAHKTSGIRLWNVASGRELSVWPLSGDCPHAISYSADGKYLYAPSGNWGYWQHRVWETATGQCIFDITIGYDDGDEQETNAQQALAAFGFSKDDEQQARNAKPLAWSVSPIAVSSDGHARDLTLAVETIFHAPESETGVAVVDVPFFVAEISSAGVVAGARGSDLRLFQLEGWPPRS